MSKLKVSCLAFINDIFCPFHVLNMNVTFCG